MADQLGKTYNRLTITEQNKSRCIALCSCGNTIETSTYNVTSGRAASCGCLRKEVTATQSYRHGETYTPTWYSWASMKNRCNNGGRHNSASYHEKGITYCVEWEDYVNFKSDMGIRPEGKTLDRIDNAKGYFKGNCRWATPSEQVCNRSQYGYNWGTGVNTVKNAAIDLELLCL